MQKAAKLLLLLALVLLTAGCWDARDINERNILTAVIIDKTDYGFAFYVEIPPIEQTSSQNGIFGQQKSVVVKTEGRTLAEAREDLDHKMDRPIFLGAVQSVILTDRMATYGSEEYMQRLRQLQDYRKTVDVIVTTDDPEKLLETSSEHSASPGTAIYDTIESLVAQGQLIKVPLMEILERLSSSYQHYMIPTFTAAEGDLSFTGLSVMSGGMKTAFIPASEANSIIFMQNKKAKMLYTVPYKDEYAIVQVMIDDKRIQPKLDNGKTWFTVKLKFKAILVYLEKSKPVKDEDMAIIQATLKAMLEKEFSNLFLKSQSQYDIDCYELFEAFQNKYPEEYRKMNWAMEYRKVGMNLSVSVDLSPTSFADYQ